MKDIDRVLTAEESAVEIAQKRLSRSAEALRKLLGSARIVAIARE